MGMVFPDPVSPWSRRWVGSEVARSENMLSMAFFCPMVSLNGSLLTESIYSPWLMLSDTEFPSERLARRLVRLILRCSLKDMRLSAWKCSVVDWAKWIFLRALEKSSKLFSERNLSSSGSMMVRDSRTEYIFDRNHLDVTPSV